MNDPTPALKLNTETEELDHEIIYDHEYTQLLNSRITARYGGWGPRAATHVSDLFMCLRKAHGKRTIPADEQEPITEDLVLTWSDGLQFEDLVGEGEKQVSLTYCFECRAVGRLPEHHPGEPEQATCRVCGKRWLVLTPDAIVEGIVNEYKSTRKSRKNGPAGAPWWIDQLRSYLLFARRAQWTPAPWGRIVVRWLMGDYGERKRGRRPRPPYAALDAFKVVFKEGFEEPWEQELRRRKTVVEGREMPELDFKDSPRYSWECATCPVGNRLECPRFIWDEEGNETYPYAELPVAEKEGDGEAKTEVAVDGRKEEGESGEEGRVASLGGEGDSGHAAG